MARTVIHRGVKIRIDAGGAAKRPPSITIGGEAVAVERSADGDAYVAPDLPYKETSTLTGLARALVDHRAGFEPDREKPIVTSARRSRTKRGTKKGAKRGGDS